MPLKQINILEENARKTLRLNFISRSTETILEQCKYKAEPHFEL